MHSESKTFVHVKEGELEALDLSLHLKQEIRKSFVMHACQS